MEKKRIRGLEPSDTGQVERLLAAIEFSKALVSAYDMETLLTAVLERIKLLLPAANWSLAVAGPPDPGALFCRDRGGGPGVRQSHPPAAGGRHRRHRGPNGAAHLHPRRGPGPALFRPGWIRSPASPPAPSSPCPWWCGARSSGSSKWSTWRMRNSSGRSICRT